MATLRFDLVFSYWIYVWYMLYAFTPLKIQYSPKFSLILGLIDNIIMLILMIMYGTSKRTIFYFILINILIKVFPLYYLRNEIIKTNDIYFTLGLFLIFIIWLHINKQSLIGNTKLIHDSLIYEKDNTPFMSLLGEIKHNYKNLNVI
jgi:hypothetical protein